MNSLFAGIVVLVILKLQKNFSWKKTCWRDHIASTGFWEAFISGLVAVWWIMHRILNSDSFFSLTQLKTFIFCWHFLMLLIHLYGAEDLGQLLHVTGSCPNGLEWPYSFTGLLLK